MQKLIFLIKKNKLLSNKKNKLNNIKSGETRFCCTSSLCSHISPFARFGAAEAKAFSPSSAGEPKRFKVEAKQKSGSHMQSLLRIGFFGYFGIGDCWQSSIAKEPEEAKRSISTSLVLPSHRLLRLRRRSEAKTANAKKNFCIKSTNRPIDNFNLFWNCAFDKGRLKSFVLWFLNTYGEYKTIELLEQLKNLGFGYATKAGVSLGIDDLKIPSQKFDLINQAESNIFKGIEKYKKGQITGVERLQQLIDVWNQTSEFLKQEVIRNFETTDLFNPVYMMAFSGARGNISQVRQLVGMRGLMSDPQGNIIDFPIQSNFREGLTLTEYIISTYGARKGIVDTALRTATAGYLTRRLVDVAQHVMISQFDCGTTRGIFLFDMKEGGKTIYSFQNRLIGRVLANDIDFAPFGVRAVGSSHSSSESKIVAPRKKMPSLRERRSKKAEFAEPHEKAKEQSKSNNKESYIMKAYRNQEISSALAASIAKITKKAFVRSPLTCETRKLVCQLCYGWSLASSKLVSLGEAVGVIAAQSIGEPGTQLTMRTFHTGGVFSGGLTNQIIAPYDGYVEYSDTIPGTCIRTPQGDISFLTKAQGSFFIKEKDFLLQENVNKLFRSDFYTIPAYAILFARNKQQIFKKQIVAQFSSIGQQQVQRGNAEQTVYAELEGEISFSQIDLLEQQNEKLFEDVVLKAIDWSKIWILSGKIYYDPLGLNSFGINGDFFNRNTTFQKIYWHNLNSCFFDIPLGIRSRSEQDIQKNKISIFKGIKRFSLTKNRDFFYKKRILNLTFNSFKSSLLSFDSLRSRSGGKAESTLSFASALPSLRERSEFGIGDSKTTKELKKLTDSQKKPNQTYKKFEQKESILNINIDNFNLNREKAIFFNKIPKNFYIKGFKNRLVLLLNKKTSLNNEVQQNFEIFSKSKIVFSKFYNNKNARFYKIDDSLQLKRIKQKMNLLYEKMIKNYYLKNFKNIKFNMFNSYTNKENHKNDLKLVGVNKVHRSRFWNRRFQTRIEFGISDSENAFAPSQPLLRISSSASPNAQSGSRSALLSIPKKPKHGIAFASASPKRAKGSEGVEGFGNEHRAFGLRSENADHLKTNSLRTFGFAFAPSQPLLQLRRRSERAKGKKQKKKKIAKKICLYNKKEKTTNIVTLKALLKNKTNSLYYYPFRTFIRFFLFRKINRIHFLSYYMKKALKSSVTKKKKKLKYLISDVNTTKQTNIKKLMNPFMLKNSIPNFLKKKTIKKRIFSTIPEIENSLYDIYNFKKVKKTDIKNYSVLSQSFISKLNEKKQNFFDIKGHSYYKIPSSVLSPPVHGALAFSFFDSASRTADERLSKMFWNRRFQKRSENSKAKNINNRIINGFYKRKPILTFPVNKISFKKFGYIFSINKSNNYNLKSKIKSDFILSYFPLTNSYNTPISSSNINDPGKNFQKLSLGNTLNFSPFSNIAFRWFPLDSQTISNGIYIWSRNFLINERTIEKNIKTYNKVYKENPDFYISNYYFFQKKRWIHLNGLFKKYNKKEIFNFNKYMNKLAQNIKNINFIYINNYSFSQSKIGASLLCQSEVKDILLFDFFASAVLRLRRIAESKQAEAETKEPKGIEFKNNKKNEIMCFNEKKLNNQLQIYEKYRKKSYNLKFRYDLTLNQRLRIFVTKKYVKKLFYFNQSTFKEIEDILKIKTPFFNYITKFSKFSVYKQDFYYIPQENSRFNIFNIPFFLGSSDQYIYSLSQTSQQSVFNSLSRSIASASPLLRERKEDCSLRIGSFGFAEEASEAKESKRFGLAEEGEKQKSSENKFGNQLSFKFYLSNRQGFKKFLPSEVSGLTRIYTQIPKKNLKTKLTNKNFGKIQEKEFLISCLYNNNLKNTVLIPKKFNKKTIYPQNNKKHKNFISSIKIKKASYNLDLNIRHKMSSNIFKKFLKKQKNKQFGIHSSKEQANSNLKNIQCSNLYKYYDFNKNLSNFFTSRFFGFFGNRRLPTISDSEIAEGADAKAKPNRFSEVFAPRAKEPSLRIGGSFGIEDVLRRSSAISESSIPNPKRSKIPKAERKLALSAKPSAERLHRTEASEAESVRRQQMHKRIEEKPFIAQLKNQSFFFSCIPFISCQQSKIDSKQKQALKIKKKPFISTSQVERIKKPGWVYFLIDSYDKLKIKNFLSFKTLHQTFANEGKKVIHDICFEQNKIYIENVTLSPNSSLYSLSNISKLYTNKNCRFFNGFVSTMLFSTRFVYFGISDSEPDAKAEPLLCEQEKNKNISIHKINQNNLALLFRPIQHKILPNPQLLKKQISNNQKNSYNNYSILFYKDYHSNLLNLQNCPKKSLSKFPSIDFQIRQVSQNINLYSLNHSRYRTIKEHTYNKKKLKNNVDSFASAALSTVKKKPSFRSRSEGKADAMQRQSEKAKKNPNCFITLYNNKTPVKLKKQSYDKKVSFYTKKYSMYNKPYYFSNIYYSAYKIHSFSLELKNTKPLGLDFGFNIPTIILKPSYSNVIKQQNLNFLGIHLSSQSAEPKEQKLLRLLAERRRSEKPKKEQEKNYSKNLRENNLSQMFYYLMKKNMLRKLWVSKTVPNFSIDSYKIWFNKNRVSSINLKTNLNSFFAFFYLYPLPFIEWSLTRKEDYLANNVLSSNKKIQNTKNCLFPNSFYKNFFNNNIKFQNMKNSILNYKQAGILNLRGASAFSRSAFGISDRAERLKTSSKLFGNQRFPTIFEFWNRRCFEALRAIGDSKSRAPQNKKNSKAISMQPFSIAFPLIKNSFLLYKAYNKILANQVYATTNLLSPFEGELLTQNNKNKWWNQSAETDLTHKKLNLKHYIFLTKKDMFSISLDLNSNAKITKYIQQDKKIDINEYLSLFSTLYSNYTNLFNKNIKQQTQKKLFDKLKNSNLNNLNVHCVRALSSSLHEKPTSEELKLCKPTSLASSAKPNRLDSSVLSLSAKQKRSERTEVKGSNAKEQDKYFSTYKKKKYNILNFVTKYQNKIYKLRGLSIGKVSENKVLNLHLGKFLLKGDNISLGYAETEQDQKIDQTGQLIHLNSKKITLRYAQPFLISPKGILHVQQGDYVYRNAPIITLPFETLTTGDIVQGIPKVEQYLEARTTQNGRFFLYSLPVLQKAIFERYRAKLPLEQAVAQSFLKIQQIIVDGVQRVYRSQGVSIAEKHLEVIVKQMTSKVQIIHGGQTGFFPGELVDLEIVESVNKFLMVKIRYEPIVLGITRASLEVESFLSAASFQQTTKILAKASLSKKKDYLKGLKENLLVGNLIPAGTGFMNSY
uniref:DNA-directed RNA polymerase subunit beta'' n=1 Tax=Pediastrum angulosum TaxID=271408 RepID=A0A2U8GHC0_9CHLO|nr:RNA polymerase beta subunit [Pediastrum angulosum]AWI68097.1 RNA polymerase beta subunit [Pediastrum angulosum]